MLSGSHFPPVLVSLPLLCHCLSQMGLAGGEILQQLAGFHPAAQLQPQASRPAYATLTIFLMSCNSLFA